MLAVLTGFSLVFPLAGRYMTFVYISWGRQKVVILLQNLLEDYARALEYSTLLSLFLSELVILFEEDVTQETSSVQEEDLPETPPPTTNPVSSDDDTGEMEPPNHCQPSPRARTKAKDRLESPPDSKEVEEDNDDDASSQVGDSSHSDKPRKRREKLALSKADAQVLLYQ